MKFFKIFIFFILLCFVIVKSEQLLGEIEISNKNFAIDASVVDTNINYVLDDTIKTPKIVITSIKGDATTNINDIVFVSEDKSTVTFGDYTELSSSNKLVGFNLISMIIASLLSIVLFFTTKKSSIVLLVISIISLSFMINGIQSISLSDVSVRIDVKVPSSFQFESFKLKLNTGSSNIAGLITSSLDIDGCSMVKDHSLTINKLIVFSSLKICSTKDIKIKNLELSTNTIADIKTTKNVDLQFLNGYSGSISIDSPSSLLEPGCTTTVSGEKTTGTCNGGSTAKVSITASNSTIVRNIEITCPMDNSWRVTPAQSGPATNSPSIFTTQPSTDINYGKSNLVFMGQWGFVSKAQSIFNGPTGVENSFTVNFTSWAPDSNILVSTEGSPTLKSGLTYVFSLEFMLGQKLGSFNTISNMTIYFFDPQSIYDPNGSSQYFQYPSKQPLYLKTFNGDFTSNTSFIKTNITFSPTQDIGNAIFALQINRTTLTGPDPSTLFIKNMKITIPSKSITTPTLLSKDSELVNLPRPSVALDPQDISTCTYKQTDLVHWHNPSTWSGGFVPLPSSNIVLPEGKRVLISPCSISQTETYKKITIPATSELVFSDSSMTMHVQDIYVQGKLTMGTSTCRYNANINIIFHGNKTTSDTIAQYFGSKGIAVASGGFISVQGKQYHNTWTKLSATAWSGDYVVYVQDSINWEVGQQVLVTTSVYKDEINNQNEVMTIAAVQGKVIQFTQPLKFYHYGGQEYQAEVALLSRRIVFRGDGDGEEQTNSESFGGHVLVNGEGQFSGIRLIRMGQTNIKARYPLHYHLAGTVKNSYISDCSVTNSYYRCYTIHGTNNVSLVRNVAFDVRGHCYYLEDGVEVDNNLWFNFASYVHPIGKPAQGPSQTGEVFQQSDSLTQPADSAAGCYYITNAYNSLVGNAASGGWSGFAFPNLDKPIGNHRTIPIVPSQFPLKEFTGNTAHSSGYYFSEGGSIYVGGNLTFNEATQLLTYNSGRFSRLTFFNGTNKEGNQMWMRFNNTKIYLSNRGINHWGERVEVVGYESHDSIRPATLFGKAWLSNAIVNGQSGNIVSYQGSTRQGFQFYDTYVQTIVSDVNFRNFFKNPSRIDPESDNRVIISMTHSDVFKPQGISATKSITLTNVSNPQVIGHSVVETGSSRYFNFIDWDSSLVPGRKVGYPTLVGSHQNWWQFDNTCTYSNDWLCWVCDKGDKEIASISVLVPGLIEDGYTNMPDNSYVGTASLFGSGITNRRSTNITRNAGITGVSNMGWYLWFSTGTPTYINIWLAQVIYKNYLFIAIPYPANTQFTIKCAYLYSNRFNHNYTLANSAAEVRSGNGTQYYFDQTHLFIKAVNFALDGSESFNRGGAKVYNVFWKFNIFIQATNKNVQPVNGFYTNLNDVLPSSTL
ncbi:hypothetical protein RB653_000109 [Dictyostelium firmibasis]|uniref:G8 domain-containing protein n=1 Tax=Dictyostelium firmibasis TaxID=79012 RepID=A0AAN7YU33_9MYCE